ncbi:protein NODULATION SIGNALING PATHWAY 1-like [Nicotiana tabacum]|uniref:Nodulation-signaling pathway 1 protein-like n=1 Tax=Nicotiana tabacum TaxID=4097 RepID=A0A1S3Z9H4_TOBAC|nr:protein NODULATION SIGNALING PATHWAY 1-like [Nicotiana tomentosiformis]XP_016460867.1 PREDICTED: nodulation-signaling pathway 1 protein-like [Nicotiana tabacum]
MIKHQNSLSYHPSSWFSDTMTIDEPEPNSNSDPISEWLRTLSDVPTFFDEPYNYPEDLNFYGDSWWIPLNQDTHIVNHDISDNNICTSFNYSSPVNAATSTMPPEPIILDHPQPLDLSKKRKTSGSDHNPKVSRKNQNRQMNEVDEIKKSTGQKRVTNKSTTNNGNSKEGRWAEHLLNPCAAAITVGNMNRVQHLLYVLHELASFTCDANHRLAAHGLHALTHHLSSPGSSSSSVAVTNFASANHKFFRDSLINFNDISPWFRIPNNVANSSVLQILGERDKLKNLHILDIGVSHGVQWPTLLEELTRRSGGPPPLVRLTVITPTIENGEFRGTPFVIGPPGYNFSSQLLAFAKAININLQINRLDNFPLQNLNSQVINSSSDDETLVICAQFRLHNLHHSNSNERTELLRILKNLEPKGVVLSENNIECSCNSCGDFATSFSRRVEYLWRFLDSTSVAYKGRESEERRMMEGEAAKALTNTGEMNERKEKWCERMRSVGFVKEVFGEDAIDGARALLRKYDSNWEMRVEERDGCVDLWWKGQPISFSSLWKIDSQCK